MNNIIKRIMDLKKRIQTPNVKLAIQRLQQSLYESKSKATTSEKVDKNNSAKNNDSNIEEDIERFLYNRYNR
jgi:predicted type IV restriction endonuclease